MTLATTATRLQYTSNGVQTVYPYTFRILEDADLLVLRSTPAGVDTVLTLNIDYTVSGVGNLTGGSIVLTSPATSGYVVTIMRVVDQTQEVDLKNQGAYHAEVIEEEFDRLTMLAQQAISASRAANGSYDAGTRRLTNLGTAVAAADAVSLAQLNAAIAAITVGAYNPVLATGSTVARTLQDRFADVTNARDFGYLPAGTASANALALQAALDATPDNGTLLVPAGNYAQSGAPTLQNRTRVTISGYGAKITLTGVNSFGVKLAGINNHCTIEGFDITGSGVVGDNHCGVGTAVTPGLGVGGAGVVVRHVNVRNCVRGIYLDVGTTFDFWKPRIFQCNIYTTVGTSSGQGYGITLSGTRLGEVNGCYVEYSTRHGIYVSAGDDNRVINSDVYRHRYGIGTGNTFGAIEIARCNRTTAIGCHMVECTDNAMDVLPDETATRAARDNKVLGCTFIDSTTNDMTIGNQGPSTSGAFQGVLVYGNTFTRSSSATNAGYAIRIFHGFDILVATNRFNGERAYSITIAAIYLSAAEGVNYTDRVTIRDNNASYTATGGGFVAFVEIASTLCTGSKTIRVLDNDTNMTGGAGGAVMLYDTTRTSTTIEVSGNSLPDTSGIAGPNQNVGSDLVATGGYRQTIDGWYQENVAASQSAVAPPRLATTTEAPTRWIALRSGSVTGVAVKSNAARAGGTLTIAVYKNGSVAGSLTAVLDGTNTTFKATVTAKDTAGLTFVAGDELEPRITTDSGWLPTTADIRMSLEVET